MKFWEIFRFEVGYQARSVSTWLYFALHLGVSFIIARSVFVPEAQEGGYFLNAPFAVAQVTLVACILSLLSLASLAGGAATRDVETRMHPILYTAPINKVAYLGGRFLAAFALGALLIAGIPIGILGAALLPGARSDILGPIQPAAYASAYFLLALPNAFVAMALMFSAAVLFRRGVASYLGAVFVLFAAVISWQVVATLLGYWELAKLMDPVGLTVFGELGKVWTPGQKNTLVVGTQAWMLSNRLAWIGIALGLLALTYFRFRFAHISDDGRRRLIRRQTAAARLVSADVVAREERTARVILSPVRRTFGAATRARQTLAVASESFRVIVMGWGLPAIIFLAVLVNLIAPLIFQDNGFPQLPTTGEFVNVLEQSAEHGMWLIVPLLIVYYAGELVWREREVGLSEIVGALPVPVWVSFAGKFAGLAFALAAAQALLMGAAIIAQARMGYYEFEVKLYARILFGIRLTDYLLFALLALAVHALVNQKYVSHLIVIIAYVFVAFGPQFGIEPGLLVYGSDPGWTYSDMRGLNPFFGPWFLFKLYWAAWALLLAVAAKLQWSRGVEPGIRQRLQTARRRLTRTSAWTAAAAAALVLTFGGLIFYNTRVLHTSQAVRSGTEWRAEYERRYGRYAGIPQPSQTATNLRVEIYPELGAVEIRGTYDLVNRTEATIGAIHVATALEVETRVEFDQPARLELADEELGHRIYALETPLSPGDSLRLEFEARFDPRGFPRSDIDASVATNGTFFGTEWLPRVGYQRGRELRAVAERREHGLPARPEVPSLNDPAVLTDIAGLEPIMFEAVVVTDERQIVVAPGALRREWTEGGRRYFHYATDAPIRNNFAFFSAAYAVREARWNDVEIQVFHHLGHALNVNRMIRSVQASLDLYRELEAVTPEELRYLLVDLLEANTYWELAAKQVEAKETTTGEWQVTLDVRARKITVDEQGVETEVPMDDLVEVGVFGAAEDGNPDAPLNLQMRRIRSGEQRITLTVPKQPARAGIDPRNLLIDVKPVDNLKEINRQ